MHQTYWGFKKLPFENVADPRLFYRSAQHEEALGRLLYAAKARKGATMLIGDVGCGKTLISRAFVLELASQEKWEIALITHPTLSPTELLREILYQLGINANQKAKVDLLHSLNDVLIGNMEKEKHTVIMIDEAQAITDMNAFEELRLLLNFQLSESFLLTLILLGQLELEEKIAKIPALNQRIGLKYHLTGLNLHQVEEYIAFRLRAAGSENNIFTEEAINIIHRYSQGIPRKINNICDMSLLLGFGKKLNRIDADIVIRLADEVR